MRVSTASVSRAPQGGFVMLFVLVVLAILSAVIVAQVPVVVNNTTIGVRSSEDTKARDLAEGCLAMLQTYVDADLGSPIPAGKDFDQVLNPNDSTAIDGDEFIPSPRAGETAVLLPAGLTGSDDFLQRHRWLLIPQPVGTSRGACLVRFDDNSDETRPLSVLPAGIADDADEGVNAASTTDIPFKDRDRAIYLSAIGLFPFLSGTTAANAYAQAHARVTLRRLYSTGGAGGSPTILAGGDVSGIKGALCSGGIGSMSKTAGVFKNAGEIITGGCGCGAMIAELTPDVPPPCADTATCPCAPVSASSAPFDDAALAVTLASAQPPGDWDASNENFVFENQSFGPAPPTGAPAPLVNLGALDLGTAASCKLHYSQTGEVFVWDRNDTANGCDTYTTDPVQRPCTWDAANPGVLTSCAATQTPCWKRVHNGGAASDWKPDKDGDIPNVVGTRRWGKAPSAAEYLCGEATGCSDCTTAAAPPFAGTFAADKWAFGTAAAGIMDKDIPGPAYLAIENLAVTSATTLNRSGNATSLLRASFITNGAFDINQETGLCGVGCDCSSILVPITPLTSCALPGVATLAAQNCSVVRVLGKCSTGSAANVATVVGDYRCGTIDDNDDNGCFIGNLAAMSVDSAAACDNEPDSNKSCFGDAHFCWKQTAAVIGNVYSASSFKVVKDSTFTGTVTARESFCGERNVQVFGNIVVGLNVGFKGSSVIIRSAGTGGASSVALRAMVETAW